MNVLFVNVPSRKGGGGFALPLGLLYAASIVERCGHKACIVDIYADDMDLKKFDSGNFGKIDEAIKTHRPSMIGYGGIATSYGRTKALSAYVKRSHPGLLQVAGGPLASTYRLLLTKTDVAVVFHGETEKSLPVFLKDVEAGRSFLDTPGISYLNSSEVVTTEPAEQVKDLDTIPLPSFDLVDVDRYLLNIEDWITEYGIRGLGPRYDDILKKIGTKKRYISIATSRGCTHRCLFCYRHVRGIRQHSVDYVIRQIRHLKERYGVDGFHFGDELFNQSAAWVNEFCDTIERDGLDIFYLIAGARVDRMDEKMLIRLKETGCINIFYGQESGSDTILKEFGKGVTRKQNADITALTDKLGIFSLIQLVIGSPSETDATIDDTIRFLKEMDARRCSLNYLIPFPQTPIWKSVEERGLVPDLETYLDLVAERGGDPIVNLTKVSDAKWRGWAHRIRSEMKLQGHKGNRDLYRIVYGIGNRIVPMIPSGVKKCIPQWVKRLY